MVSSFLNQVNRFDRIDWMGGLVLACFVGVLILPSQSAASYPSYLLAILMLATWPRWSDLFSVWLWRMVLLLVAWLALSAWWSAGSQWRDFFSIWVRSLLVLTFVVALAECQLRGRMQLWMTNALTTVGVVVVIAASINFFVTNPEDGRLNGLGQLDTHVIAALVYAVVLLFVVRFVERQNGLKRILGFGAAGLIVAALFLSDSRNAWVSAAIGVMVYLLALKLPDVRQYCLCVIVSVLLLGIVLVAVGVSEAVNAWLLPRGDSFRFAIWSEVISRLEGNWLVGLGILADDNLLIDGVTFHHPHSMYLAMVYQGGLIALFLYLTLLAWVIVVLLRYYDHPDAKLALGVLAIALFAHLLDGHELIDKVGASWFMIWYPVGIAVGLAWSGEFMRQAHEIE